MIGLRDRFELPRGVVPGNDGLVDDVRGVTLAVNDTGLALVDAATLREMAERCIERFGAHPSRALRDAQIFALDLNRRFLLNVRVRGGPPVVGARWLRSALVLARHGTLPRWPARRRALDTTSTRRAAFGALRAAFPAGSGGGALAMVAPLAVGLQPALAASAAVAIAVGVAVHEAGHAAALRGVPAFVGTRGARVAVVHRALPRRRTAIVALAGPAVAGAVSLGVALLAWALTSAELAIAGLALSAQAVALTVVARDGRRACDVW